MSSFRRIIDGLGISLKNICFLTSAIVIAYIFVVKVNIDALKIYPIFRNINPIDVIYYIINDTSIEMFISLLIILFAISKLKSEFDIFIVARVGDRRKFFMYKLCQIIFINIFLTFIFIATIYFSSVIFLNKNGYTWTISNSIYGIVFGGNYKSIIPSVYTKHTILEMTFLFMFLRNISISTIMVIISRYVGRYVSLVITIALAYFFSLTRYYSLVFFINYNDLIYGISPKLIINTSLVFLLMIILFIVDIYIKGIIIKD